MKSKLLIFIILLSGCLPIQAQSFFEKGWVVTASGDTLIGFIAEQSHRQLAKEVIFKAKKKDKPRFFKPKEAKSFFIEPNQYFESHPVTINDPNGRRTNDVQHFLFRSEAGYLSVYSMPIKKLILIKKQGDSVLHPLYMTVTTNDENENKRIDTLTNENLDRYGTGRMGFRYEYIYTLSKLLNEGQSYTPSQFPLEESRIIQEVKQYNKTIHPDFKSHPITVKETWNPVWSVGFNYLTPIRPSNFDKKINYNTQSLSSSIQGYEIVAGIQGKNRAKGVSIEVGFNKISQINTNYSYTNTNSGAPPQYFEGKYESSISNKTFRINYTTNISTKFSPYFSIILGTETYKYSQSETERGTNNTKILAENASTFDPNTPYIIESVGFQYALTRQHLVRTELNFSFGDIAFNRAIFKIGYQYRLWK